ncbi:MAG: hypothetical protein SNJ70_05355 [Armatimonadota bacterium]
MIRGNKGSASLIGILVVAVIIIIGAVFVINGGFLSSTDKDSELLDKSSQKQTVVGKSMDTAKATECRNNLKQIRTAIEMEKTTNETLPKSLQNLKMGVSADFFKCPVSGKDYIYNPSTGEVKCPTHPNH